MFENMYPILFLHDRYVPEEQTRMKNSCKKYILATKKEKKKEIKDLPDLKKKKKKKKRKINKNNIINRMKDSCQRFYQYT